jgi:hypothetical protein
MHSQSGSVKVKSAAVDLAREVVTNELTVRNEEQNHWIYRLESLSSNESHRKTSTGGEMPDLRGETGEEVRDSEPNPIETGV